MLKLNSSVYIGDIRHRRFKPVDHQLKYPLFMLYLDLDELPLLAQQQRFFSIGKFNLASFYRDDYLNPNTPDLKQAVIEKVYSQLNMQPESIAQGIKQVRMLTNVRYCGYSFNPVSFYYCFDADEQLVAILAEITNTPWDERHSYVLPIAASYSAKSEAIKHEEKGKKKHIFNFDKQFHVSPFNPMKMKYHWVFSQPLDQLQVHMENLVPEHSESELGAKHFDATLVMERYEFYQAMPKVLFQFPFMTCKVVWGIYWNALKLWLKKSPFYDHPNSKTESPVAKN